MITSEELVRDMSTEDSKHFKLATVVELFENETAKLQFDGEDITSEKQYSYLDCYTPQAGDRVLLAILGGTYIILGKVNYDVSPSSEEEIDRYLFDLKKVIMMKGLSVSGVTELAGVTATSVSAQQSEFDSSTITNLTSTNSQLGNASADSVSSAGAVSGTTGNFSNGLNVNGGVTEVGSIKIKGALQHNGSTIGFFGASSVTKAMISNLSSDATLSTVTSKVNEILTKSKGYGFFG